MEREPGGWRVGAEGANEESSLILLAPLLGSHACATGWQAPSEERVLPPFTFYTAHIAQP